MGRRKAPQDRGAQFSFSGVTDRAGSKSFFQGRSGAPSTTSFWSGNASQKGSLSAAVVNIEVRYSAARIELYQLIKDLWFAIVRNSAWLVRPASVRTIFADSNKDGVTVGWEKYPSDKSRPSAGAIGHSKRWEARKEMLVIAVNDVVGKIFNLGRDTLRSDVAKLRVSLAQGGAPISYAPMMQIPQYAAAGLPGSAGADVNVPIRSGQRKGTFKEVLQGGMAQPTKRGPRGPYKKRSR